jgi:hypothetical protein
MIETLFNFLPGCFYRMSAALARLSGGLSPLACFATNR